MYKTTSRQFLKKRGGGVALGVLAAGLFLLACRQESVDLRAVGDKAAPLLPKTLLVRLAFDNSGTSTSGGGAARTVRPSFALSTFEKIVVQLYEAGALVGEQVIDRMNGGSPDIPVQFDLRGAGVYSIEAAAYRFADDPYPLIRGRGITDISDEHFNMGVRVTIDLALSTEARDAGGNGSIALKIEWPVISGVHLDAKLFRLNMTDLVQAQSGITGHPATVAFQTVPAGNYFLALEFKNGDKTAGYFLEAVTVLPGLVANRWVNSNGGEDDKLVISSVEMRTSAVTIQSLLILRDGHGDPAIQLESMDGVYWPVNMPGLDTGHLRLQVQCLAGQAISPLTKKNNTVTEYLPVIIDGGGRYSFDVGNGGHGLSSLQFTVFAADGSAQKTYTVFSKMPVASLLLGGETTYYETIASAFEAVPQGSDGTVTLFRFSQEGATVFGRYSGAIPVSGKAVTLAAGVPSAGIEINWGRDAPFFEVSGGGSLTLQGFPDKRLILDGGRTIGSFSTEHPIIRVSGSASRLIMGDNVFLQNNNNTSNVNAAGAVLVDSGAVFTMNGGMIQGNKADASRAGSVLVHGGARFEFFGGVIGGSINNHTDWYQKAKKPGIFIDYSGVLCVKGSAVVEESDVIYLGMMAGGSAWATLELTGAFSGSASIMPQKTVSGSKIVYGSALTAATLERLPIYNVISSANVEYYLTYVDASTPEGQIAQIYYISNNGYAAAGTLGNSFAPCISPYVALDKVPPGSAAKFVFMGMVSAHTYKTDAVRPGYSTVPVWIHVDGQRNIVLSGSGSGISGYSGDSTHAGGNHPALWIAGGSRVTLENGMEIRGTSTDISGQPISLVNVYSGTLIIKDTARVVTASAGNEKKTIGVRAPQGWIQLDSPLTGSAAMYLRPLDDAAHGKPLQNSIGNVVVKGSQTAAASQWFRLQCAAYSIGTGGLIQQP